MPKLKTTQRLNSNQSVKFNQAIKLKHPFKSVLACFHQDDLSAFRFLLFSIFYNHAVDFIF
ncbi:hypothetical protein FIM57_05710 [Helicobacter pylori]|nr:hypothetical protein FIM57_05710 [Helicobacter pylori]